MSNTRRWNKTVVQYALSCQVDVVEKCFAIEITNLGDTIAVIAGVTLFPSATPATVAGDSQSFIDPLGGEYKGSSLQVRFQQPVNAAPLVEIIQLFYLD